MSFSSDSEPGGLPSLPETVALWRLRAVLHQRGLTLALEAAMDALPEPTRTVALTIWEYSPDIAPGNPLLLTLGAALGMTPTDIDALFRDAVALEV